MFNIGLMDLKFWNMKEEAMNSKPLFVKVNTENGKISAWLLKVISYCKIMATKFGSEASRSGSFDSLYSLTGHLNVALVLMQNCNP